MEIIDYDLLKEDIVFPIKEDTSGYSIYVWDSNNNMIANYLNNGSVDEINSRIIGGMREFKNESMNKCKLIDGRIIHIESGVSLLLIRGWGRLQYKNDPEKRQDNIANYLLNCMNSDKIFLPK